jgi:quercetin dioxygenase-like cupin family protein
MKKTRIEDYKRGWFIGDFEPSLLKTKDFEVSYMRHSKGEVWPAHYHKRSEEYNVLIEGKMIIQGQLLVSGDVFMFEKDEIADPVFLEDCKLIVVKVPSVIGDKYEVLS